MNIVDRPLVRWAAALASGVMLALSVNLHPVWWLAWLAPIPLLIAALRARAAEAAALAFIAGVIETFAMMHLAIITTGPIGAVIIIALVGCLWAIVVSIARALIVNSRHWLTTLAYPAAWAALEVIVTALSPHATYGSRAYSQMNSLEVIQVAALTGTPGIVFLMSIPASLVAIAAAAEQPRRPPIAYGLPLVMLAAALGYGLVRLAAPIPAGTVTVGLAAVDQPDQGASSMNAAAPDPIWNSYLPMANSLAQRGAQVVIFPEAIALADRDQQAALKERLSAEARADRIYLLAGVATEDGARLHNRAWVFGPDGNQLVSYAKHHPVPGLEARITPGQRYATLNMNGGRAGVAICKDMDFPALSRRYGRMKVAALLVPASDFGEDGWMHSRMAVLRGVEDGFSVFRSANDGMLTASDPYGRVMAQMASAAAPGATLVATAPIGAPIATVYSRVGDAFAYVCIAALLLAEAVVIAARRRKPGTAAESHSSAAA